MQWGIKGYFLRCGAVTIDEIRGDIAADHADRITTHVGDLVSTDRTFVLDLSGVDVLGVLTDDGVGQQFLNTTDACSPRQLSRDEIVVVVHEVVGHFDGGL